MEKVRFPGFYKLSIGERLKKVKEHGLLSDEDIAALRDGHHVLPPSRADKMIENVIGVMGLPLGLGLNFRVNQKDYLVPLVVEEPSIVAALSSAAKIFLTSGGIESHCEESLLIGQIQVVNPPDADQAATQILFHKQELIDKLNDLHPNMVKRGGGVKDIEVRIFEQTDKNPLMLIVHILADTCDAMGANIINTMCEEIAADIEALTEGRVFLRILSNLTDRSVVRAQVRISPSQLEGKGYSGEEVRDGIILASQFAEVDPYRAATHNKGIMNGIDPVAIATGNDWRAIEAAAHAYAARDGRYTSLTRWFADEDGNLVGTIEIPLKVGIRGGSLEANDTTMISYRMLNLGSARELAELMAAVGLAQNFSAIKALSTEGIQKGHMSLHARSVAVTAGAPKEHFETVVSQLIDEGEVTVTAARRIIARLTGKAQKNEIKRRHSTTAMSNGKVILLGEHAVVYGKPAIAVPIKNAVVAEVTDTDHSPEIKVPAWDIDDKLEESNSIWWGAIQDVFQQLGIADRQFAVHIKPNIPAAMGLGGSAAIAVAIVRSVSAHFNLSLSDEEVNHYAFLCEKAAHGTPSGIDNTIATYGQPLVYQSGEHQRLDMLDFPTELELVIGISDHPSLTVDMVAGVRDRHRRNKALYVSLFDNFAQVAESGIAAIKAGDYKALGHMMTINHGLLSAIQVSSPELDR
ncbi:MAG: hydroxymethylglutaryl-CoA reductase, degradative, partial [Proteobacteria bacterium]|nr:hydroxymethylglutaryl-CoA reductase, degradative [Pseudomonadota bacterium]